jgi:ATP-binding cassette subfamily B protein
MIIIALFLEAHPNNDAISLIPKLAAMALGAQRLLPLLQQTFGSWSSLKGAQYSVVEALDLMRSVSKDIGNTPRSQDISFKHSIKLTGLSFRHSENLPYIFQNINFEIPKGACFGIVGKTGVGKSTFLDLIMGLLEPTSGSIVIDSKASVNPLNSRQWQKLIAHVPQNIFLLDRSIAENITLSGSREEIDYDRLLSASKKAALHDFVNSLPDKYESCVGERGVRLSGGQRQRIAIARALYKGAQLIILDEATSALDPITEALIIKEFSRIGNDATILMVSHKRETLKQCDAIFEISNGIFVRV